MPETIPIGTYISITDAAEQLGISPRRCRMLAAEGRLVGATRLGLVGGRGLWLIPSGPGGILTERWPGKLGRPRKIPAE